MRTERIKRKELEREVDRIIRRDSELSRIKNVAAAAKLPLYVQYMMMIRYLAERTKGSILDDLRDQGDARVEP